MIIKPTPHIEITDTNVLAKTILMPGDPLRAEFIAKTFLTDVVQINSVRGMIGFTGYYKGRRISVMGSGMGMPSIGIYSYELFKFYGVEQIVRIGSAGSYTPSLNVYDVALVTDAYSESSFAYVQSGDDTHIIKSNEELNEKLIKIAKELNIQLHPCRAHSSDVFYHESETYWKEVRDNYHCDCVEMESFALFHNAKVLGKKATCLLTISDSFITHEVTTSEERAKNFKQMVQIALELAE